MRSDVSLALVLLVVMSGCLGQGDRHEGNWVVEAVQVNDTTGVPIHDITREELAPHVDLLKAVEGAAATGDGQRFMTENEAREAIEFIEGYEAFDPETRRSDRPGGVYFLYRNRTIVVEDEIHDVTKG